MSLGFFSSQSSPELDSCARRRISPTLASGGMIASQHPLVTSTGLRVMASGGNAVDAAVAAALVGTVVMPGRCGLGGDLFAVVARAASNGSGQTGLPMAFHGSGIAPRGASLDYMLEHGETGAAGRRVMPQRGPNSPSVPGFIDGCFALLDEYGSRPFSELAMPAVGYAADGFPLSPAEARGIAAAASLLGRFPTSTAVFLPNGSVPQPGSILRQSDLGATLAQIASGGTEAFYRGDLPERMAAYLREIGGALESDDFADHQTAVTPALATTYRDFTVFETGLPTQGFVVLEALNICAQTHLSSLGIGSAAAIHTQVEALRLAFADRHAYAGDPDFVETPLDQLLSAEWAADRYATIDPQRMAPTVGSPRLVAGDTTYLCAIDGDGLMVSLIFSLSGIYGSGVVAGDTGVLLNNRAGNCFELDTSHPNVYAPGKRTMHTLNCYLIADPEGTPVLVGGTPGGDSQPQWNVQTITGLIDGKMDVQAAVEQPRWQFQPATYPAELGSPFSLTVEGRVGDDTIKELEAMGYPIERTGDWGSGGSVQVIARDPESGVLAGGSDPRAEGLAIGL